MGEKAPEKYYNVMKYIDIKHCGECPSDMCGAIIDYNENKK